MATFRKKPVLIQAWPTNHLLEDAANNWKGLPECIKAAYERGDLLFLPKGMEILTLEGKMLAGMEDFVIQGIKGELYPCKRDIFFATYDQVHAEDGILAR